MTELYKRLLGLFIVALSMLGVLSAPFQQYASLPTNIRIFEGAEKNFEITLPTAGTVISTDPSIIHVENHNEEQSTKMNLQAMRSGSTEVQLQLANIPIKKMKVDVLPNLKVYPGGQSIGVKLSAQGVIVVGYHYVQNKDNRDKYSPGEKANLRIGDMIVKMNGTEIKNLEQIGKIVQAAGETEKEINMEVLRNNQKLNFTVNPSYDEKENKYRLGIYIRNSAAGVGTLTFYDPKTKAYGALGHVISDMDTQQPIIVGDGEIVHSTVSSIKKGAQGNPGEKFTHFLEEQNTLGNIKKNTPFGIFGTMKNSLNNEIIKEPIPIALSDEVKKGPAKILTVVEGQKIEEFVIEITDVIPQKFPATKGLIIKVTDPVLLEKTGGIVQGMSGSPIIQDGKLVGAVTHVFVSDPTSGYGCYIEWMLQDAGIPINPHSQVPNETKAA